MLPYDYRRCQPDLPDSNCKQCQRWAKHPDQTWGPRTPFYTCASSGDENCAYIPVNQDDNK